MTVSLANPLPISKNPVLFASATHLRFAGDPPETKENLLEKHLKQIAADDEQIKKNQTLFQFEQDYPRLSWLDEKLEQAPQWMRFLSPLGLIGLLVNKKDDDDNNNDPPSGGGGGGFDETSQLKPIRIETKDH